VSGGLYVFKTLEYILGNLLDLLTLPILQLLNVFKLSMRLKQLLDRFYGQRYDEVASPIKLPVQK